MPRKLVYLSGPIFGMSDVKCLHWRMFAQDYLATYDIDVINPMDHDYRGDTDRNEQEIVEGDLRRMIPADAMLILARTPSWGTAMEVYHFNRVLLRSAIVAIVPPGTVSPWLKAHTAIQVTTLNAALEEIVRALVVLGRIKEVS